MTAKTLREYSVLNALGPKGHEWYRVFTPATVSALIAEIDRLRVIVGEKPSYESEGTLKEWLAELTKEGA